jgi:hypothetical protein
MERKDAQPQVPAKESPTGLFLYLPITRIEHNASLHADMKKPASGGLYRLSLFVTIVITGCIDDDFSVLD